MQIRESTSQVRVCEPPAHPVVSQSSGGYSFASYTPTAKKNATVKLIVSLKQSDSEGFIRAP